MSLIKIFALLISTVLAVVCSQQVGAVSASDWQAGSIINDALFYKGDSMGVQEIQAFLESQTPTCDTWGLKLRSDGQTRASYGTSVGVPPPYICVKDYYENPTTHETNFNPSASIPSGAKSAAQIIYEASVRHNINPKVLLVTIKKEAAENILGDDWPWPSQYRSITGYGCPDTAPCDAEYYGFYNQIENAAKQFRRYATYPQDYRYQTNKTNFIQYNPNAACGGSNVFIQTTATAGLYNYTPYQPNQAALNNLYGTGDGCSAYGNRNFWRIWSDWFGSTNDERLFYRVIKGDASGEVYLQTHLGKYYVPSYTLLAEWGLGPSNVITLPQAQVNLVPVKGELSNVLTDGSGLLYLVEGGGLRQVTSQNHTAVWGVDTSKMVESLGLSYALPKKEPLGRFMTLKGGDGSVWLADGDSRHYMPSGQLLYAWGYYPGITNTVSPYFFSRYIEKRDISQYATVDGTKTWAIDASTKRPFKDKAAQDAYVGPTIPTRVRQQALNLLQDGSSLTIFAINNGTRQWFMIDNGKKHYIPQGELAALWGKSDSEPLTPLTDSFMSFLAAGPSISYTAQSSSSSTYWLIAKNKHPIPNGDIYTALTGTTNAPQIYSDALLSTLSTGQAVTVNIKSLQSPYNYTYVLENGARRYPATPTSQQAWNSGALTVPYQLMTVIPEKTFLTTSTVKDQSGAAYYIEKAVKYPISTPMLNDWGISSTTPTLSNTTLNSLPTGQAVAQVIKTPSDQYFVVSNGKKITANKHGDTIAPRASSLPLTLDGMEGSEELSYLISATNTSDDMWLLINGERLPLSFEQRVAFGYLSNSIKPTKLSSSVLDALPTSSAAFNSLIQKSGSGVKFLNFGHSLGFPDSPTLIAHVNSSRPILQVNASVFDSIQLRGDISRVIYDDAGRYWWIENGHKRYITSWDAYYRLGYPKVSPKYLYGTTMNLIPTAEQVQ